MLRHKRSYLSCAVRTANIDETDGVAVDKKQHRVSFDFLTKIIGKCGSEIFFVHRLDRFNDDAFYRLIWDRNN